jgi:IS30 family transposase
MRGVRLSDEQRRKVRLLRASGLSAEEIAARTGCHKATVNRVIAAAGGVPPRPGARSENQLSFAEREEISRGLSEGRSARCIARQLGREPSTITREINRNGGRDVYRAVAAERRALEQARRPKVPKLQVCRRLRAVVESKLEQRWSPQQIARALPLEFPDEPEMRVSHETIYQSLFVQSRGSLRKDLHQCLRSGRTMRRPPGRRANDGRGQITDMIMISERPADVEDRAVPGHWEGDLIIGKNNKSAIGTLVERHTRYVMLLHLPDGYGAEHVRIAMTAKIQQLPKELRRSLTWDQGKEMAQHVQFTIDTGVVVYFCPPHSPWLRGSNENTNGLLRQYFPRGTDLSVHSAEHLDAVARELNGRPRQTLGWMKPSEKFAELVALTA